MDWNYATFHDWTESEFRQWMEELIQMARGMSPEGYAKGTAFAREKAAEGDKFFELFVRVLDRYSGHGYDPITDTSTALRDC